MRRLTMLTLNIHKGFSMANRRFILPELREAFRLSGADIVFLQEVLGRHDRHASRIEDWPDQTQTEYLADQVWPQHSYGKNAVYEDGDHGNALLSRFVFSETRNTDISSSAFERRGFLYGQVPIDGRCLHLISLHLSLLHGDRRDQYARLMHFVNELHASDPLIIAGDFNDWMGRAQKIFANPLGLQEAFLESEGRFAKTYPSRFPLLRLDRIYFRGLKISQTKRCCGTPWNRLSDHLPLVAEFELNV